MPVQPVPAGVDWEPNGQDFEESAAQSSDAPSKLDRINALRERGYGIYEAKRIVLREDMVADIHAATTIGDIKALSARNS
jgi:hypothetical protein